MTNTLRIGFGARMRASLVSVFLITVLAACGSDGRGFEGGATTRIPPTPPTDVTATGADMSIIVDWFGSVTATSYNVYWSDTPGVTPQNGTRVSFPVTPGTITGLTNGTTYYAVVTAQSDQGESAPSAEVQAVAMLQPPARISGVRATPGDGEATVEWNNEDNADSYSVFWSTNPGGGGTEITNAVSPFVVTGLTNSETFYLSVAGNNAAGQGTASQAVEVTPVAPVAGWTAQEAVNTPFSGLGHRAQLEDVAINDNGVAAALWVSYVGQFGSVPRLIVNHTASGDWGEEFVLADAGASSSTTVTSTGDVHVAYDGGASVRARRYTDGAWEDVATLSNKTDVTNSFGVAMDADGQGNVFLAWVEDVVPANSIAEASQHSVWVARFDAATETWGAAETVGMSVGWIRSPRIVAGDANTAIVTWLHDTVPFDPNVAGGQPDRGVAYASRFDGVSWQPGAQVGSDDLVDFDDGNELAIDGNAGGSAVVTWTQTRSTDGTPVSYEVGAARYDAALGQWSAPETILDGATQSFDPSATIDNTANILAAWTGGANTAVSGSEFDPATSVWGPVSALPTDILGAFEPYGIGNDEAGALILAWAKDFQVPKGIFVKRREAGSDTWGDTDHLGGRVGSEMLIDVSGNGNAIVITQSQVRQADLTENIVYATIYTP